MEETSSVQFAILPDDKRRFTRIVDLEYCIETTQDSYSTKETYLVTCQHLGNSLAVALFLEKIVIKIHLNVEPFRMFRRIYKSYHKYDISEISQ